MAVPIALLRQLLVPQESDRWSSPLGRFDGVLYLLLDADAIPDDLDLGEARAFEVIDGEGECAS